jgi:acyl carrier protein
MNSSPPSSGQVLVLREQLPLPQPYIAPRTPTETTLAQIWCNVLSMDRIGTHDSYQDLGGDSFFATVIFAMIQETFRIELPMAVLVSAPTILELALRIDDLVKVERAE